MPSVVKSRLNAVSLTIWQPAEVNAGTLQVTAGIAINNESGVDIAIHSIAYSVWCLDLTDYAKVNSAYVSIQRGISLTEQTIWQTVENFNEMLLFYVPRLLSDVIALPRPIMLPSGAQYAIVLGSLNNGLLAGGGVFALTAFGGPEAKQEGPSLRKR